MTDRPIEAAQTSADDFKGDTPHLVNCIQALLNLDAAGAVQPRVCGHARILLAAAASRLDSAPPAAATVEVPDERKAFEAWCREQFGQPELWIPSNPKAGYESGRVNDYWTGWQARAALSTPGGELRDALIELVNDIEASNDVGFTGSLLRAKNALYARPTPAAAAGAITKERARLALAAAQNLAGVAPQAFETLRQFVEQASAAAAGVPPTAMDFASRHNPPLAVTQQWIDGWDACRGAMLAAPGAPAGAPSEQKEGSVHQAVSTSSVPDGVHSGEAPASAPLAGGSEAAYQRGKRAGYSEGFLAARDGSSR